MAVELVDRLNATLGCDLPSTASFDYPTLDALVGHLMSEVLRFDGDGAPAADGLRKDERAQAMAELDDLSEAELIELLAETIEQKSI